MRSRDIAPDGRRAGYKRGWHPRKLDILDLLEERGPASARELAGTLEGLPRPVVATYHLLTLRECGLVETVGRDADPRDAETAYRLPQRCFLLRPGGAAGECPGGGDD